MLHQALLLPLHHSTISLTVLPLVHTHDCGVAAHFSYKENLLPLQAQPAGLLLSRKGSCCSKANNVRLFALGKVVLNCPHQLLHLGVQICVLCTCTHYLLAFEFHGEPFTKVSGCTCRAPQRMPIISNLSSQIAEMSTHLILFKVRSKDLSLLQGGLGLLDLSCCCRNGVLNFTALCCIALNLPCTCSLNCVVSPHLHCHKSR